jgi:Sulfotransferase domain
VSRVVETLKPIVPASARRVLNRTVRMPLSRVLDREVRREVDRRMTAAGFRPIDDVEPEDVVIVAYPKSGSTWFRYLVEGAVYGIDASIAPPDFLDRLLPAPHSTRYYRRFQTPMFFKTHHLPRPEYRRVVYLIRDGRDVMVSLLHHLRRTGVIDDSVDLLQLVQSRRWLYPSPWPEHVDAWDENPYGADRMTIRYEDLLRDPVKELTRLCEFSGVERDPSFLAAVAERTTFDRVQARAREIKARRDPTGSGKLFFRRGQAGSHRDEMSAEALHAFLAQAGPALERSGYPIDRADARIGSTSR